MVFSRYAFRIATNRTGMEEYSVFVEDGGHVGGIYLIITLGWKSHVKHEVKIRIAAQKGIIGLEGLDVTVHHSHERKGVIAESRFSVGECATK